MGGIRSGKTYAGSIKALTHAQPRTLGLVIGPTYKLLRDSTVRTFREIAGDWVTNFNKTDMLATLWNGAEVLFRSADEPDNIRGITADWAWLDEAAYQPDLMWRIAIGRLSKGARGGPAWLTTTPNGLQNWVYEKFVVELPDHPNRHLITASINDNFFLPADYIADLRKEYVGEFARQELDAAFTDMGGTLFKREWFLDQWDEIPPCTMWVRFWDLATSVKQSADYTVGALLGLTEHNEIVVADIIREKLEAPDIEDLIVNTALDDGPGCLIGVESTAFQLSMVQNLLRRNELLGYTLDGYKPDKSKYARAMGWATRAKHNTLKVARRWWTPTLLSELLSFKGEENSKVKDDQVDAISGGVAMMSQVGVGVYL